MVNLEKAQPEGGSIVGGRANPQYLTLVYVNSLLEQEMGEALGDPQAFLSGSPIPTKTP